MKKAVLAMIQTHSRLLNKEYNLSAAERAIRKAADQGADIVCLPELFASGYYLPVLAEHLDEMCEERGGETVSRLCALAGELDIYICAGVMVRHENSEKISNSAVMIDRCGEVMAFYSKQHMFGDEGSCFTPEGGYVVVDTDFAKVGMIICYDNNFSESAAAEKQMGAKLILCPCAWRREDKALFKEMTVEHARENGVYLCSVNMYGQYDELDLFGGSITADGSGNIIAQCGGGEDVMCCELLFEDGR